MTDHLKRITIENLLKIKSVDIDLSADMVLITGANEQGKSAVLKVIEMILKGKKVWDEMPIHNGARQGKATLETDKYTVEMVIDQKKSSIKVLGADRIPVSSPAKLLNTWLSDNAVDPMRFKALGDTKAGRREQAEVLKRIAGIDFSELDEERDKLFKARTEFNSNHKLLKTQAGAYNAPPGTPDEFIDVAALLEQLSKAEENNRKRETAKNEAVGIYESIEKSLRVVEENDSKRKAASEEFDSIKYVNTDELYQKIKEAEEANSRKRELEVEIERLEIYGEETAGNLTRARTRRDILVGEHEDGETIDTIPLQAQIESAATVNENVSKKAKKKELEEQAEKADSASEGCSWEIEKIDNEKFRLLNGADLPIDGLSIEGDTVYYNGLPLKQASGTEELRVSTAIAIAEIIKGDNDAPRFVLIQDATSIDTANMQAIQEMCSSYSIQIICTKMDESGVLGIVIEDGEVKAVNAQTDLFTK